MTLLGAGGWNRWSSEVPPHLRYPTSLWLGDILFNSPTCNWEQLYPSCSLRQRDCWLPNLPAGEPKQHRHSARLPLQPPLLSLERASKEALTFWLLFVECCWPWTPQCTPSGWVGSEQGGAGAVRSQGSPRPAHAADSGASQNLVPAKA